MPDMSPEFSRNPGAPAAGWPATPDAAMVGPVTIMMNRIIPLVLLLALVSALFGLAGGIAVPAEQVRLFVVVAVACFVSSLEFPRFR